MNEIDQYFIKYWPKNRAKTRIRGPLSLCFIMIIIIAGVYGFIYASPELIDEAFSRFNILLSSLSYLSITFMVLLITWVRDDIQGNKHSLLDKIIIFEMHFTFPNQSSKRGNPIEYWKHQSAIKKCTYYLISLFVWIVSFLWLDMVSEFSEQTIYNIIYSRSFLMSIYFGGIIGFIVGRFIWNYQEKRYRKLLEQVNNEKIDMDKSMSA